MKSTYSWTPNLAGDENFRCGGLFRIWSIALLVSLYREIGVGYGVAQCINTNMSRVIFWPRCFEVKGNTVLGVAMGPLVHSLTGISHLQ